MSWLKNLLKTALDGDKKARLLVVGVGSGLALLVAFLFTDSGSGANQTQTISVATKTQEPGPPLPDSNIWVDIVGAIRSPGVYALAPGSRVFELVALAGGFQANADQSSINLARNLTDGEQIHVLPVGDNLEAVAQSDTISINSATAATLETLPGVGPKLAARIVDWRNANQGFKKVADLRKVGGIGDKLFAAIKDLVSI